MRKSWAPTRSLLAVAMVTCVALLLTAGLASACVAVVSLTNSSPSVEPGGTVTVTGREFAMAVPVLIHLDSPTGPVLATVPPPEDTMTSSFTVTVPIPPDITTGRHLLVATQDHHDMNSGAPARSVFHVGTAPPVPAPSAQRPAGLATASEPSVATLAMVASAVALGLVGAGVWSSRRSRRHSEPRALAQ